MIHWYYKIDIKLHLYIFFWIFPVSELGMIPISFDNKVILLYFQISWFYKSPNFIIDPF